MRSFILTVILLSWCTFQTYAIDTTVVTRRWTPAPVEQYGSASATLSLTGEWKFSPSPEIGVEKNATLNNTWKKIKVPGEWVMQGFKVPENQWAAYARHFTVPASWTGKQVKLRCLAVYSESEVYINGHKAGYHLGGFTPFEIDITAWTKPGEQSLITIKVRNESSANATSSGSAYAVHPLGGIPRDIELLALPPLNLAMFHVSTKFDKDYRNAILTAEVELANDSKNTVRNAPISFELFDPSGKLVFRKDTLWNGILAADASRKKIFNFPVIAPLKWDPEHPRLYSLKIILPKGTNTEPLITRRTVGFRQIEVRGNQVFVNNQAIKLRGVCRHETTPRWGRSVSEDLSIRDVKLFREANVNYIRTSHYPPSQELVAACDSLGMFLEVEAPFCWAHQLKVLPATDSVAVLQMQTIDMVNVFRSHPSILLWSMGNESFKYKEYFSHTAALVKKLDPTRPRIFSQWGPDADNQELEITNHHYPGPSGPDKYASLKRPIVFDEYVHINAYNRYELVTDPGIREAWGIGFASMWERMYHTPSVLGGAIWAGIDDSFFLPDSSVVGYGTWGIIDSWRRKKPEFWSTRKVYSPVRIQQTGNLNADSLGVSIENRLLFSNLSECVFKWRAGKRSGILAASAAPGKTFYGPIRLGAGITPQDTLYMEVYDPRNVLIDQYALTLLPRVSKNQLPTVAGSSKIRYQSTGETIIATTADLTLQLNTATGSLLVSNRKNKPLIEGSAELLVLALNGEGGGVQMTGGSQVFPPYTATATHRIINNISYNQTNREMYIRVEDQYDEAHGYVEYRLSDGGLLEASFRYTLRKPLNPRQWGLVFTTPNDFNTLWWKRNGLWNYYPADQIGRLTGTAVAYSTAPVSGAAGPSDQPSNQWKDDRNILGTNDFRSTKMNITAARIGNMNESIHIMSDGSQHLRAWKEDGHTRVLVASYSNLGSEGFFRDHASVYDRPLKAGDIIQGTVKLNLQN